MTAHRLFTVADVDAMVAAGEMDHHERVELIDGELVWMSPKGLRHEALKIELLDRWFRADYDPYYLMPVTTFRLSEDTYLETDAVVVERSVGVTGLTGATALLVVEIADSSLDYDTGRKAMIYARFGVRELWVIDAVRLVTHVFREPSDEGYRVRREIPADEVATPLAVSNAFALRLADLDIDNLV